MSSGAAGPSGALAQDPEMLLGPPEQPRLAKSAGAEPPPGSRPGVSPRRDKGAGGCCLRGRLGVAGVVMERSE